jgi:hypothetical protein
MIGTLDEAWKWIEASRKLSNIMARLGGKHWVDLPWAGKLGRDGVLQDLEASEVEEMSRMVLGDLEDLGVLLLFSVFEATVRQKALADIASELPQMNHPAIKQAMKSLKESVEHGSFYRVLESYKGLDSDLIEEVNQVRRYRNWVAHGRHGEQPDSVTPVAAYKRLKRFITTFESLNAS